MKSNVNRMIGRALLLPLATLLFQTLTTPALDAAPGGTTPAIAFTQDLVGKQVCLQWAAQPGVRYAVQKSTTLAAGGAGGGFATVAMVSAEATACQWVDPEATGEKAFYRIEIPAPAVFALEPPVLSTAGGDIDVRAQCLPTGSFLRLEIPGAPPTYVDLELVPVVGQPGLWRASYSASAIVALGGGSVITASVVDGGGVVVAPADQTVEVTNTGFASDAPPALPPAAPVPDASSNPIPGVGIGVKRNPGSGGNGRSGPGDDDSDGAAWAGKKGYDYYQAQSALTAVSGIEWPELKASDGKKHFEVTAKWQAQNLKYVAGGGGNGPSTTAKKMMGQPKIGEATAVFNTARAGASLPGEVTAEICPLPLMVPAGPPLAFVLTYRSMAATSSAFGPNWTSSYDISVTPMPPSDGAAATRVRVCDGSGRCDIYVRRANGTYACDGMFRTGTFANNVFTLTFADRGRWVFRPLDGSPGAGKIASILDRNNVALACAYSAASGQLQSVSSQFGQSISLTYNAGGGITRITDHTGRFCTFSYFVAGRPGGNPGMLQAVSCPQLGGGAPTAGPTAFTYSTGCAVAQCDDNLLTCRDGAGRLISRFTYSVSTDPLAPDFDRAASETCADSGDIPPTVCSYTATAGGLLVGENDPLGRVTETTFDRQHRPIRVRQYSGFATAGVPVTPTTNRPAGQLRASDPAFYETTCVYNAQHCLTVCTEPDGLQTRHTYQYDLSGAACPVAERGNARVRTLVSPGGEKRTVSMESLPGFGAAEGAKAKAWMVNNFEVHPVFGLKTEWITSIGLPKVTPKIAKESHGKFRLPLLNYASIEFASIKIEIGAAGYKTAEDLAVRILQDGNCEEGEFQDSSIQGGGGCFPAGAPVDWKKKKNSHANTPDLEFTSADGFCTRLTTTLGQTFTWDYDAAGNRTACRTPITGAGCDIAYNALGQVTSTTVLNGPGSSLVEQCVYDAGTAFCTSVVRDPAGLHLTDSCTRDPLGRIVSATDPRGYDTLFAYNPLDQCITRQSPPVGTTAASRITTTCFYDAGGLPSGCDVEHRDATGALVSANPAYSTRYLRESPSRPRRVTRFAVENRPVALAPGDTDIAAAGLANFDVCDYLYNEAGECVEARTPAVTLAQPTDVVCSYQYDERGMLHRRIQGAPGTPEAVTTECDYTPAGDLVRGATLAAASGGPGAENPTVTFVYDGFRRCVSRMDPMGNVETYLYDNRGYVTCTLSGELNDVPGSTGNVPLATCKLRVWQLMQGQTGTQSMKSGWVETVWNKQCVEKDTTVRAFFDVFIEDDTMTVDRFTPGSALPAVQEVTTVDRSPAGLVQSVSTNGDLLVACQYDTAGRLNSCADGTCSIALTLDACANVLSCARTDRSSVGGVAGKTFTTTGGYDAFGRCIQTTEGGSVTTCDFDSLNRILRCTLPNGTGIFRDYDGGTLASPYSVRTRCDVDGDGNLETLGSVYARTSYNVSEAKPQAPRESYVFNNPCVEKDTTVRLVTDSNGSTTTFTCDSLGRCVQTNFPDGTHESCAFDNLGRKTGYTRKSGAFIAADFNYRGCVTSTTTSESDPSIPPVTTVYQYDGLGNIVRATQGGSDIVCAFDSCSDLLAESQDGHVVSHTYNHRGRNSTTYPDGSRINEIADSQGRLISCAAVGTSGPPIVTFEYLGRRVSKDTRLNGVVTTFTYRGDGDAPIQGSGDLSFDACVQSTVTSPNSSVLSRQTFSRNRNQQLIRRETAFNSDPSALAPLRRQIYTLDRLDRVTRMQTAVRTISGSATVTESDVSYTLDLEGNRLTATGGNNPGSYSSSSSIPPGDLQMKQYTTWPGGELLWDANGCLTSFAHGTAGNQQLTYDAHSRLVSVAVAGTAVASFGYDACDRLVSRTIPGGAGLPPVTTRFIYDGEMCIHELGGDGLPDMTFAALGHCISTRNGTLYYPHGSSSSSVSLITSSSGTAFERFDFDDGGKPIFLDSNGVVRQGANRALSNYDWLKPSWDRACIWSPQSNLFLSSAGNYSPELGRGISAVQDESKGFSSLIR